VGGGGTLSWEQPPGFLLAGPPVRVGGEAAAAKGALLFLHFFVQPDGSLPTAGSRVAPGPDAWQQAAIDHPTTPTRQQHQSPSPQLPLPPWCSYQLEELLAASSGAAADPDIRRAAEETLEAMVVCESCNQVGRSHTDLQMGRLPAAGCRLQH